MHHSFIAASRGVEATTLHTSNIRKLAGRAGGEHPVLAALDQLCAARQQEQLAWRAFAKARGLARRAQTKVEQLESAVGGRRRSAGRS